MDSIKEKGSLNSQELMSALTSNNEKLAASNKAIEAEFVKKNKRNNFLKILSVALFLMLVFQFIIIDQIL